jgi:hypothetical protein
MAQQIGPHTFTVWQGVLVPARQEYALFAQPGVDGFGAHFGAFRAPPQTIITKVTVADLTAANLLIKQYRQLHEAKQLVTVTDQFNSVWPSTLVLDVGPGDGLWGAQTSLGVKVITRWELLIRSERVS